MGCVVNKCTSIGSSVTDVAKWCGLVGCCCPSPEYPDSCCRNYWVWCLYNKLPVVGKKTEEKKSDIENQFFQSHKLNFKNDPNASEYPICCRCCSYIGNFPQIKSRSFGHMIYSCCRYLKFCLPCFQVNSTRKLLITGLKETGKTLLMRKLLVRANNEAFRPETGPSTKGYVATEITFNMWQKFEVFDVGGSSVQRQFWRSYYISVVNFDTVVYIVNANKYLAEIREDLLEEERHEIHRMLSAPELRCCQFVFYFRFEGDFGLSFKEKTDCSRGILNGLQVRGIGENTKTKFPQQHIDYVTDYPGLLQKLQIDTDIQDAHLCGNNGNL